MVTAARPTKATTSSAVIVTAEAPAPTAARSGRPRLMQRRVYPPPRAHPRRSPAHDGQLGRCSMVALVLVGHSLELLHGLRAMLALAASPEGAVVLLDLGSAALALELALDDLEPSERAVIRVSRGALVEGAVRAAVEASGGGSLASVVSASETPRPPMRAIHRRRPPRQPGPRPPRGRRGSPGRRRARTAPGRRAPARGRAPRSPGRAGRRPPRATPPGRTAPRRGSTVRSSRAPRNPFRRPRRREGRAPPGRASPAAHGAARGCGRPGRARPSSTSRAVRRGPAIAADVPAAEGKLCAA